MNWDVAGVSLVCSLSRDCISFSEIFHIDYILNHNEIYKGVLLVVAIGNFELTDA